MTNRERDETAAALISYQHQLEDIANELFCENMFAIREELRIMARELRKIADLVK